MNFASPVALATHLLATHLLAAHLLAAHHALAHRVPYLPAVEHNAAPRRLVFPKRHASAFPAVTKADIVDRIAEGTGLTKLETEAVIGGFLLTVREALEAGDSVELRGFGSFRVTERAARTARNPQTDEPVQVPRRFVPVFKASQEFRRTVNDACLAAERRNG